MRPRAAAALGYHVPMVPDDMLPAAFEAELPALVELRRDLHAHPELSFHEERTSERVAQTLASWGIPTIRGLARTGVVGVIRGAPGPRGLGLRADMDALPMTERNTFAHASRFPGRMHACGHDGHTATLLAAARPIRDAAAAGRIAGTVYLVFQPAEEGGGGAREMIADGLFERCPMDAIFGLHNWPGLPEGSAAVCDGPCFASSNEFRIVLQGKGAHAAMPHLGIDPVPAAAALVQAFQTIVARNVRPIDTGVVSVTILRAGEASNVIPDSCELQGTVRSFTTPVLDLIERRMRELTEGMAAAWGLQADFSFRRNYPPTVNHPAETAFLRGVMHEVLGPERSLVFEPTMGAEDFSFFLQHKPGAYFVLGNGDGGHREAGHGLGPCMLHNPSYDFNDRLIPVGARLWTGLALRWLAPGA